MATLVLGGVALLLILGCNEKPRTRTTSDTTAAQGTVVPQLRMATFSKAFGNTPYYVARHLRWFEQDSVLRRYRIEYGEFNDRAAISDALANGRLEVLFSGDAPAILTRAQGNDIRIVSVSGNARQEVLVPSASPIRSVSELRGKRIAVQQGTSSHYALLKILEAVGLRESDVDLRFMAPAEARPAFEAGAVDAWAVWAPFVEQQEVNGRGRALQGSEALINNITTVPSGFLARDEAAVRAIVTVLARAKEWMIAHPVEAQRIAVQQIGLDSAVVATAWPKFNWRAHLDQGIVTDLQAKASFLASADKTRQGRDVNIRNQFLTPLFPVSGPP
jgi:sulfonate transport system substrate-binding protein